MKIPLVFECGQCHKQRPVFMDLNAKRVDWRCACGWTLPGVLTFNMNAGLLILRRARYELRSNDDPSLCIVFAAMAVECEISRFFFKWSRVGQGARQPRVGDAELE